MPVIMGIILEHSKIYTDGWKAYDGLVLNGYEHYRAFHSENEFAHGKSHVNGIENFWSFAKRRVAKFNGCASAAFAIYSKEYTLARKFQTGAVQPQICGLASTCQKVIQKNLSCLVSFLSSQEPIFYKISVSIA